MSTHATETNNAGTNRGETQQPAPKRGAAPIEYDKKGRPKLPKSGREKLAPSLSDAPKDVLWAVSCWLITAALQALGAVLQYTANQMDNRQLLSIVRTQLEQGTTTLPQLPGISAQDMEQSMTSLLNLMLLIWGVLGPLVCAWLTIRAGRGGGMSRMFLTVGSVYLVINALIVTFSTAPSTMATPFVIALGVLSILSGITAALGLYFMSRPENAEWLGVPNKETLVAYEQAVEKYRKEQKEQFEAEMAAAEANKKVKAAKKSRHAAKRNANEPKHQQDKDAQ